MDRPDSSAELPAGTAAADDGSGTALPESAGSPAAAPTDDQATATAAPATATPATAAVDRAGPVITEITWRSAWRVVTVVLAVLLLLRAVTSARTLVGMVAISFFFSLALDPGVRALHHRYGWRRGSAVGVIYLAGFVFTVFLMLVLIPAIGQVAAEISAHFDDWVANLSDWVDSTFGVTFPSPDVAASAPDAGVAVGNFVDDPMGTALGFASASVSFVFNLATIAMFTFYFTADAPGIQRTVLRLFSPRTQERIGWTWDQAIVQTGGYFYSRMLLMLINGTGFFLTMAFVGVPIGIALGLAVFAGFVSEFIPAIGTYIGGAVPILLTLVLEGVVAAVVVLAYVLIYQQVENYWLSPKISSDTMSLNGGVAFGAALFGGAIAGPMGAFVALPVAALISSAFSNYARFYDVVYDSPLDDDDQAVAAGETTADGVRPATA